MFLVDSMRPPPYTDADDLLRSSATVGNLQPPTILSSCSAYFSGSFLEPLHPHAVVYPAS